MVIDETILSFFSITDLILFMKSNKAEIAVSMKGLDKLRASELCESREASVKKKETQVKTANLQMRS